VIAKMRVDVNLRRHGYAKPPLALLCAVRAGHEAPVLGGIVEA
jgi:hypothetical protein